MVPISVTAQAGAEIVRRIASGELEIHGILLRDTMGKKFRYIIRGLEDLPSDAANIPDLPSLGPLQSALNATQLLQAISVAQNAAMAASLRRIEVALDRITRQLTGIEGRLTTIATRQTLLLEATRSAPASRLAAAKTAAVVAFQAGDRTALISAGQNAEQAARDLLAQVTHLASVEENRLPVALLVPTELADLAGAAGDAARVASAIWIALGAHDAARTLMSKTSDELARTRRQIALALQDPAYALRRGQANLGSDDQLLAAGRRVQGALHEARGREMMIASGAIVMDQSGLEFESVAPSLEGLSFVAIDE